MENIETKLHKKFIKKIISIVKKFNNTLDNLLIKNRNFTIISNNCWGGEVYKTLNKEFNTPFIGLYIDPIEFHRIILNLDFFINYKITSENFLFNTKYPIANIENINIHFSHYHSIEIAIAKWNRRMLRMKKFIDENGRNNIIIKLCDHDSDIPYNIIRDIKNTNNKCIFLTKKNTLILKAINNTPNGKTLFNLRIFYYLNYINLFR